MLTLDFLQSMTDKHGDQVAIEDTDSQVTYTEMAIAAKALAVALQMNAPTPGSRVALWAANSLEYLISVLAVLEAGKILVPLSCESTTDQLHQLLNDTHPTVIILDDQADRKSPRLHSSH